jgi:hypothetical protein
VGAGFFVIEVVVQRALGHACPGQNGVQVSAPKARAVHLPEGGLHQEPACALWIPRRRSAASRSFLTADILASVPLQAGRRRAERFHVRFHVLPGGNQFVQVIHDAVLPQKPGGTSIIKMFVRRDRKSTRLNSSHDDLN